MVYKLSLTTKDGTLLETYQVGYLLPEFDEASTVYDLSCSMNRSELASDIAHELRRHRKTLDRR